LVPFPSMMCPPTAGPGAGSVALRMAPGSPKKKRVFAA
jgi:hypothetical protein